MTKKFLIQSFNLTLRDPLIPGEDIVLVFDPLSQADQGFERPLQDFQAAAQKTASLSIKELGIELTAADVQACTCIAQSRLIDLMKGQLLKAQSPTVIVELNAGLINDVSSDIPIRVLFLDQDTEGGDEENIVDLGDGEVYLSQFEIKSEDVNGDFVQETLNSIATVTADVPACRPI